MGLRVLVVDDEMGLRDTLAAILQLKNYEVQVAADGVQGYDTALAFHPDLVISDVVMPNRNGVEMAMMIAKALPTVKILLISGQAATKELLQNAHSQGHDFLCLSKPIPPTDLLEKVEELLQEPSSHATVKS